MKPKLKYFLTSFIGAIAIFHGGAYGIQELETASMWFTLFLAAFVCTLIV